ncbi:uncharacterized protein IL334_003692 [Kwoniella shivajii]|uniref:Uncharacterized protein n=1 Tax=Kwoniella shivajii TaxID=564305 RepID=A0ABZ1CYA5_9TREE|nr:hypothetical protein IL334_003692 [Kwoniella shivajii]
MTAPSLIPSSFLPPLPRSQYTLSPLHPADILARISILRELYLPPIHGGFTAADVFDDEPVLKVVRGQKRERRFSAGLVETMDGVGLGLDVAIETRGNGLEVLEEELSSDEEQEDDDEDERDGQEHLEPFEREWAEKWLGGIVRRSQGWIEENEDNIDEIKDVEMILRDATAVLAMMAGTSAAGSLTRHLVFPLLPSLAPALSLVHSRQPPNPALSPETNTFLASLSTSPSSPSIHVRRQSAVTDLSASPSTSLSGNDKSLMSSRRRTKSKRAVLPILLHDAPMGDHLSVGVQTWGSAILLGRQLALRPEDYGLFLPSEKPIRILELGAGTGLLSILCRKLLDLRSTQEGTPPGLVVATDFLDSVLDNLKICVDLNFPPKVGSTMISTSGQGGGGNGNEIETSTDISKDQGIHIAKLDWTTFPSFMQTGKGDEELSDFVENQNSFDLVLASDCVYDETHAKLLREVAGWTLKPPDEQGNGGGTFHILSPLRPTFAPELASIDQYFPPISTYTPLSQREQAARSPSPSEIGSDLRGEGLGLGRGLKLGSRGEGKRGVKGKKGEGRVDENGGYWWWEVGWG